MSTSQTVWSGVFAAIQPHQLYQQNLNKLETWLSALLTLVPIQVDGAAETRDTQKWASEMMHQCKDDPHQLRQNYAAIADQLAALSSQNINDQAEFVLIQLLQLHQQIGQKNNQLQQLQEVIPDLAVQVQQVMRQTQHDQQDYQTERQEQQHEIEHLQRDIRTFLASMTALVCTDVLAVLFGLFTTGMLWPFGALVWLILVPTMIVVGSLWYGDWVRMREDRQLLMQKKQLIVTLTAQMIEQETQLNHYEQWIAQTTSMQQRVGQILAAWQTLSSDIGMAIAQMRSVVRESTREHQLSALQHLEDAQVEWCAAYEQIEALCIDERLLDHTHMLKEPASCDHIQSTSWSLYPSTYQQH